jgi:hypothetical protein
LGPAAEAGFLAAGVELASFFTGVFFAGVGVAVTFARFAAGLGVVAFALPFAGDAAFCGPPKTRRQHHEEREKKKQGGKKSQVLCCKHAKPTWVQAGASWVCTRTQRKVI